MIKLEKWNNLMEIHYMAKQYSQCSVYLKTSVQSPDQAQFFKVRFFDFFLLLQS